MTRVNVIKKDISISARHNNIQNNEGLYSIIVDLLVAEAEARARLQRYVLIATCLAFRILNSLDVLAHRPPGKPRASEN